MRVLTWLRSNVSIARSKKGRTTSRNKSALRPWAEILEDRLVPALFQAAITAPIGGNNPFGVAVADFNGDGRPDIAVSNFSSGTLSVGLGNGNGTFAPALGSPFAVGNSAGAVTAADFNNDGIQDIAVADPADNRIVFFFGRGFTASPFNLPASPFSEAAADFNHDGFADLAVGLQNGDVRVIFGTNGTFTSTMVATGTGPVTALVTGDFNNDGNGDIAAVRQTSTGTTLSIYLGTGTGTFAPGVFIPMTASLATGMVAGHFNGTDRLDLAIANSTNNTITELLSTGGGNFAAPIVIPTLGNPFSLVAGDFNQDGHVDLIKSNNANNSVTALLGNGDGTFAPIPTFAVGVTPKGMAVGDFNGDGRPDLVIVNSGDPNTGANSSESVLLNTSSGIHFILSAQAAPVAGVPFNVTVTVENGDNFLATTYRGTIHFASSDTSASLPGDHTFTAGDSGEHTFSITLQTLNRQTITVTDTSDVSVRGFAAVNVAAVNVITLVVGGFASPTTAGVAHNFTVTAEDASGNTAPGYTGTVKFTSSDGLAGLPANYTFVSIDAGVHTFSATLETAETQTITVTDTVTSTVTGSQTGITVNPAAPSILVVGGYPSPTTAGVSHSFTVTALDDFGNTATSYTGTVTFTSSDSSAVLPANYTFVSGDAGVHSFSATLKSVGTQSITATDIATSTIKGSQTGITVNPAAASTLVVGGFPSPTTAGVFHIFTVSAQDAFGNRATGYTGTVTFTSSDGLAGLPANYTFVSGDAGVHSFIATLKTTGTQSITATDTSTSTIKGSQTGITVNPAGPIILVAGGFASPTTAGVSHNFTVTAQDAFGNTATGYTGTVTFTSSDGQAGLPANYTFVSGDAGVHSFSATLKTVGSQSITATDTSTSTIKGSQTGIMVNPAAASSLVVGGFTSPTTTGVSHNFTVTAQDAFGNTSTGYAGTVIFTSSDGSAGLPANYTFLISDAGVHSFSATFNTVGSQSITATDTVTSSIKGSQTGILVSAPASILVVGGFASPTTAGVSHNFSVTAQDAFGNTALGYTGTVTFTSSDGLAGLPANYTFVSSDAGVHSFIATLKTSGTQSITVTDTATSTIKGSQTGIMVNPTVAITLVVGGFASSITAGVSHTFTVTAQDVFGNTALGYTGTVTFTSSDGLAALPTNYSFVSGDAGVHSFSATLKTSEIQSITATDMATSTIKGSQAGIMVSSAAASTLVVMGYPSPTTTGVSHNFTVTAQDAFGNTAAGYTGTVTFTSSDGSAALPSNYSFVSGDAGMHSFSATLNTVGSQSITATDMATSTIKGSQTGIKVNGPASILVLAGFASPITAGVSQNFTVTAQDAFGNTATSYIGTVTFTSSDDLAVLPANYTFVSGDAGVHSFTAILMTAGSQSVTARDTGVATIKGTVTLSVNNPVPMISSVSPPFVAEQIGSFTLTVNGSGYVPSSVVDWNNSTLTTTFFSSGQLQATVPAGNVTEENLAAITVVNMSPGGGPSNMQPFSVTDAPLNPTALPILGTEGAAFSGQVASFIDSNPKAPLSDFTTGSGGASIDWGDGFNSTGLVTQTGGLGTPFVVMASHTYAEDGSFSTKVTVTDLSGSTQQASGTATIGDAGLTGNANSFSAVRDVAFSGTVASFTDTNPTASLSDFTTAPGGVTIAWGDGSTSPGTVTQPGGPGSPFLVSGSHTFFTPGALTMTVTVTDLGGSVITPTANVQVIKRFDIVGRASQTGQIYVGTSDGSSLFTTSVWGGLNPAVTWVDVQTGDFNGDGRADLIGRVQQTGDWFVALSSGSSFTNVHWGAWAAGPGVTWVDVKVGDFMGNGRDDIVGRWLQTGQWWMAQSTGSSFTNVLWGTWNPAVTWVDVNVGDFNGDHKADITGRAAAFGQWFTAFSTDSSFSTSFWGTWNPNISWVDIKVGDFDGDGKSDIVGRYAATGQWFVGLSTGASFATSLWATWNPAVTWVDVDVGNFNGDGKADIIGRYLQGGTWFVGQSTGVSFSTSAWATWNPNVNWVDVQVGDFNSDGKSDIAGQFSGMGQWFTSLSIGSAFTTSLWTTWPSNLTWVEVHADNYAL